MIIMCLSEDSKDLEDTHNSKLKLKTSYQAQGSYTV